MASQGPFGFVQFEFPFSLGPADGRYLIRPAQGAAPRVVIVLRTLGAPERRLLRRRRRPKAIDRAEVEPVATSRATLVRPARFESRAEADAWLGRMRSDRSALDAEVGSVTRELNRMIRAQRAVTSDPYCREVSPDRALAVRVGFGTGDEVADGRFAAAYDVPRATPRSRRAERLSPQEHLAAVLGAREALLASEELVLRARLDVDAGHPREAALQARIALECLLAELAGDAGDADLAELERDRDAVSRAGNAALDGDPPATLREQVARSVERMERALRRRRLAGVGADAATGERAPAQQAPRRSPG